jgi:hypothetical protein
MSMQNEIYKIKTFTLPLGTDKTGARLPKYAQRALTLCILIKQRKKSTDSAKSLQCGGIDIIMLIKKNAVNVEQR